jgi:hypothetical protein
VTVANESRRTAFRTAFLMGERGKELFVWLAGQDNADARRVAVRSLYLHWRHDPGYVHGLMKDLAGRVGFPPIGRSGRVLRFLADLSVTIYVNHPERADVLERTAALWTEILTSRLHVQQLLFLVRAPLARSVALTFSGRILNTATMSEVQDPSRFFSQGLADRQRFLRVVPLVDPDAILDDKGQLDDVVQLLHSEILPHRILAALVLATHGARDSGRMAQLLEELARFLRGDAYLWAILAFAVPLPETPPAWLAWLERMTERLIAKDPETFLDDHGFLASFDIALLPIGLAYGKAGLTMPLIDDLLGRALKGDRSLGLRVIRGLAPVGFYYPDLVFTSLRRHAEMFRAPDAANSLAYLFATMRALHFDRVDLFLAEVGAPDSLREAIARMPEPSVVARCVNWIGLYNNAIHEALNYPAMKRTLLLGGLRALGEATEPRQFVRAYTDDVLDMAERAEFQLIRWTDPSFDGPAEVFGGRYESRESGPRAEEDSRAGPR